jgi:hypothetical protein
MDDAVLWASLADEGFSVRPDGRAAVLAAAESTDATAMQRAWLNVRAARRAHCARARGPGARRETRAI